MFAELLEYLTTPTSRLARSMGFLKSSIQVRARFLRCRHHWLFHTEQTKAFILKSARLCVSRRKVVLFGAGLLHDIPLRELAELFQEVVLVDIVHPLSSRIRVWPFKNVRQVSVDLTGVMALLPKTPTDPLPASFPQMFCQETEMDLAVSVNLLSQLSWVSSQRLEKLISPDAAETFHRHLITAHLDYLNRLPCHTALITDAEWMRSNLTGDVLERWSVLFKIPLPTPEETWIWNIAPAPEREVDYDFSAQVVAYSDWKKASLAQPR